jgi:hypothetical protein
LIYDFRLTSPDPSEGGELEVVVNYIFIFFKVLTSLQTEYCQLKTDYSLYAPDGSGKPFFCENVFFLDQKERPEEAPF